MDETRIQLTEDHFYPNIRLNESLSNFDKDSADYGVWTSISRTDDYISKVEFFSDSGKSVKIAERNFTRDSNHNITAIETKIYDSIGGVHKTLTTTFTRVSDKITEAGTPK